eukprot:jgi/Tetstr1/443775/TSEL_031763.t1
MNLGADLFSLSDPRAHKYAKPLPKAASWKMADEMYGVYDADFEAPNDVSVLATVLLSWKWLYSDGEIAADPGLFSATRHASLLPLWPGGEEPQSDAYEDPARLRALRQAFADEFDPAGRVRAMSKYRAARAQCTWTSTAAGDRLPHQKWKCRNADRLVFDTCDLRADSSEQDGNSWRIVRMGPFTSYGGNTEHFNTLDIVAPRHGCLAFDSMILDFRPKGSEVMEFYIELGFRWTRKAQLGLVGGSGPLDLSNWGRAEEPLELEKIGYSIGEAQAYLLKNLAKSQRACSFHGNCSNTPQLMCAFMEQGREQPVQEAQGQMNGIEWDRYGERVEDCTSVFLNRGDVITQVMFHRRAEDRERNLAHFKFNMLFLEAGNHDAEDINAMHMPAPLKHAGDRIIGPWSFSIIK